MLITAVGSDAKRLRSTLFAPREVIEGYENDDLVETIFSKTVAYNPEGSWPLVENLSTVLDFGGGAGIHYKAAKQQSPDIRWAVVETPAMVSKANVLTTNHLRFFTEIDKAAEWLGSVDLMHSDGAIQYVGDSIGTIKSLCATLPAKMVWYRVPITNGAAKVEVQTSLLSHNGPGRLATGADKLVKHSRHTIPATSFVKAHEGYCLVKQGPDRREHGTQEFGFVRG